MLRSLAKFSSLDGNITRLVLNLLRVLNFILEDVKDFDFPKIDFIYQQLLRYLYLGTPLTSAQNTLSLSTHLLDSNEAAIEFKKDFENTTPTISSSSEISDSDEFKDK